MISESLREQIVEWHKFKNLVVTKKEISLKSVLPMFTAEGIEMIRDDLQEFYSWNSPEGKQVLEDVDNQINNYLKEMEEKKYVRADEFNAVLAAQEPLKKYRCVDFIIDQATKLGAKIQNPKGFVYRLIFQEEGGPEKALDQTSYFFVHDWKASGIKRGDLFMMMRVPVTDPSPDDPRFATIYRWIFHAIRERQAGPSSAGGTVDDGNPS